MLSFSPLADPVRTVLDSHVRHFSKLVGWATIIVAIGVALEGVEIVHDLIVWRNRKRREKHERSDLQEVASIFPAGDTTHERESHSNHPEWVKRLLRLGLIAVVVGVVGEWRWGAKLEDAHNAVHTYDIGKLTEADEKAGDAATSAKTAHDEADAVKVEAKEIGADLARTQYLLSGRSVTDRNALIAGLKQFKEIKIEFSSYNSEADESLLCGDLKSAAHDAGMDTSSQDFCGRTVTVGTPNTGVVVSGPDIQQTLAIGRLILHTCELGPGGVVSGIKASELTIFVGAKPPFRIGQAQAIKAPTSKPPNKTKPKL